MQAWASGKGERGGASAGDPAAVEGRAAPPPPHSGAAAGRPHRPRRARPRARIHRWRARQRCGARWRRYRRWRWWRGPRPCACRPTRSRAPWPPAACTAPATAAGASPLWPTVRAAPARPPLPPPARRLPAAGFGAPAAATPPPPRARLPRRRRRVGHVCGRRGNGQQLWRAAAGHQRRAQRRGPGEGRCWVLREPPLRPAAARRALAAPAAQPPSPSACPQVYAAGFLEGHLTAHRVWDNFVNSAPRCAPAAFCCLLLACCWLAAAACPLPARGCLPC